MDSVDGTNSKASLEQNGSSSGSGQQEESSGEHDVSQTKQRLTEELRNYPWEKLQQHYADIMDKHNHAEEELRARSSALLEIFLTWSQSAVVRDEGRALKRFKTQAQHVQNSEENLEKNRRHYADVIKAFENALALLNDRLKP